MDLKNVYTVEFASLLNLEENFSSEGFAFQVCYEETSQVYTLYLIAAREQDRSDWIAAIRAGETTDLIHDKYINYECNNKIWNE